MSEKQSYDIAILGAGPGGYVAAIRAAQLGLKSCLIEKGKIGGVCLNWGCIPTKALLKSAEVYGLCRRAGEFGVKVDTPAFDMAAAVKRSRQISESVTRGVEYLLKQNKVTVIQGRGRFDGPHSIAVTGPGGEDVAQVEAPNVIVATGARQRSLPGVEIDRRKVITSTEAMVLNEVPSSMVIVGAGAVGVEFAYFYNAVGCKVTLLEMMPSVLPGEDGEISKLLERLLKRQGVDIVTSASVQAIDVTADGVKVSVRAAEPGRGAAPGSGVDSAGPAGAEGAGGSAGRGGGPGAIASGRGPGTASPGAGKASQESGEGIAGGRAPGRSGEGPGDAGREASPSSPSPNGESDPTFEAKLALMAVGVIPNTADLGLEEAGIELAKGGFVKVDEYMKTTAEGVYAIGDVAGLPLLAHVASGQGIIAVDKIAGESPGPFCAELMPRCVYCQPQVASVGLTEEQAKERGHEVTVGRFPFRASGKSVAVGERDGQVKVVADAKTGRLLGAAIIGSEATELIGEPTLAQSLDDGCRKLLSTVHAHPTLSEAVMEAAGDAFKMAIHKPADPLGGGKR